MRVSLPLWPHLPQLKPALGNGTLTLWPSPNGSMSHIRPHKNNLPICQEVEKTELILVWKWLTSLTRPPSFYSVARKVDYPGLKPVLMTVSQPSGKKRHDSLFSLIFLSNNETKPMMFTTSLRVIEICSHTIPLSRQGSYTPPTISTYAPLYSCSIINTSVGKKILLHCKPTLHCKIHVYLK